MDSDVSKFIDLIWQYKPVIMILGLAGAILFCLLVVDTHRHRKRENKKRHKTKDH